MYETFGFSISANGQQSLSLFIPDNAVDPTQYAQGGACGVVECLVIGDFQARVDPGATDWDAKTGFPMTEKPHPNGRLFRYTFTSPLPDGYYQYQYVVRFAGGGTRVVGDPCTKYAGDSLDRSAFVIGGTPVRVEPLAERLPSKDLIIYELMIDDFTKDYRGARPAIDAVVDRLDYLAGLNVNAIEFMPWIAWPDDTTFSWGYDPAYFFSVESAYVNNRANRLDRLSRVAALVTECHRRQLHVLLDIVLQHARQGSGTNGFPYYWLWENPNDSPFVGQFVAAPTYGMLPLDYENRCTQQFVTDVCKYWLKRFTLDGLRFDQVSGFDNPAFPQKGAPELVTELKNFAATEGIDNLSLILEDVWDYSVIEHANGIKPSGAWFDLFRSVPFGIYTGCASVGHVDSQIIRVLNSARDFDASVAPTIYIENHDHGTVICRLGSRDRWFKAQPYMIALATCSGTVLMHNGQEWGQLEDLWEDDSNAPPQFKRVQSRPLRWSESDDAIGQILQDRYRFLFDLRNRHNGLRSPNFYPDDYDWSWRSFSPEGYGIDEARQVVIYHRWGQAADGTLERFMVVLNFSDVTQFVDVPLSTNGEWVDVLNANVTVTTQDHKLHNHPVPSNWGCLFWQKLQPPEVVRPAAGPRLPGG
jgi:1,4-alpha-glucan branching enzyme